MIPINLLMIVPAYTTFIKGQIEATSRKLQRVDVLVYHNPLVDIISRFPVSIGNIPLHNFTRQKILDLSDKPENINVHLLEIMYFLPDSKNLLLGDRIFKKAISFVQKQNLQLDLVHSHLTWPSGYATAKLSRKINVPLIITAHGYDVYGLPFKDKKWFKKIKFALDSADHIITVSRSNLKVLVYKLGIPEDKVSVIPNGFDNRIFRPMNKSIAREQLHLPQDNDIILNIANLVPVKGHEYLIRAIKKILETKKDVLLIVVGDGPLRKDLEKQVKGSNLKKHVKLIGAKPHDEIPLWMNAADIFVLPSLKEGNPTVMFEALGVGLPFVGTAVGGVPEIITSGDYGLLCPPADPECLAEKILIALDKEWDRERIRKYAEQFTWERVAEKVMGVYHEILKE